MSVNSFTSNQGTQTPILTDNTGGTSSGTVIPIMKISLDPQGTFSSIWNGNIPGGTLNNLATGTINLATITGNVGVSSGTINLSTISALPNLPGGTLNNLASGTINSATVTGNLGTIGTVGLATVVGNLGISSGTINVSTILALPNIPGGTINLSTIAGNLGTIGTVGLATISGNLGTLGTIGLATVQMTSGTLNVATISSLPNIPGGTINILAGGTLGILTNGTLSSSGTSTGVGTVTNLGSVTNVGQIYNAGTVQTIISGTINNSGTTTGVGTMTNVGQIYNAGTLQAGTINTGTFAMTAGTITGGSVHVQGTIQGNFASLGTITITLASLTNSGSVGRISGYVDNTSNKYISANVYVKLTSGSTPTTANSPFYVYLARTDNSGINDDGNGTADAAGTFVNTPLLGIINCVNAGTNQQYSQSFDTSIWGPLGPAWGIGILNNSGGSLHPTAGSQLITYVGMTNQIN